MRFIYNAIFNSYLQPTLQRWYLTNHFKKENQRLLIIPEEQLQLTVQESNQRPSTHDFSVAVAERTATVAHTTQVQALRPCGQRHNPGWSKIESWRERNEACGNWQAGWLWLALMERDCWHAAAETGHLISLREQENEAFPLFLPSASVSGHNRSVNRLRRANEKCMTEQSLRRLQEGLLCFYPTSSNIHGAVSPLIRGDSLIALNDEPRQVAKHPVRRSDAAASASNSRWQKAAQTITWGEPENRTRTDW